MMFLTLGCGSPCTVSMLAIWITGSISASGKWPFLPAHSMSTDRILSLPRSMNSPSAGWLMMDSNPTSTSTWEYVTLLLGWRTE